MQRVSAASKNKPIKQLHITQEYILLSQSYRILLSVSCFTIIKDIFYNVSNSLLSSMMKYAYMDTSCPYTLQTLLQTIQNTVFLE